jgi:DNA-binding NarL/FixJ family response regulator
MTAPPAELHALKPSLARKNPLRTRKAANSHLRLSSEARQAIRTVAMSAEEKASTHVPLARIWHDLARGISTIADAFFGPERCYLILRTRLDGATQPIERRRLEILKAVLGGARQKAIAMDLKLAPSTIALNSKLALEAFGVEGKPSRAHPLLMLAAKASTDSVAWEARGSSFLVEEDCELRVVGVPRPDRQLDRSLPSAELAVIRSLIEGRPYREIARVRGTSTRTIANQISAVFRRVRVSGRNELVQRLLERDRPSRPAETLVPPALATARPSGARRSA